MSSTSASGNGTPAGKADFDTLKSDVKALRDDLATLMKDAGSFAAQKARDASVKGRELASDAGEKAIEFRDAVGDKVRQHPFAAVGIALAAGYLIASLSRRNS